MTEVWRPVPGFEGLYEVSDHGRVRSLDRLIRCSRGPGTQTARGQLLKPTFDRHGRHSVALSRDGRIRRRYIYQLVAEAFIGPCPAGMEVCHGDGVSTNDVLSNLRYDTPGNNHRDQVRHGTHDRANRVRCPMGHALRAPNLVASKLRAGKRECLACKRARDHLRYRKAERAGLGVQTLADRYYAEILSGTGIGRQEVCAR